LTVVEDLLHFDALPSRVDTSVCFWDDNTKILENSQSFAVGQNSPEKGWVSTGVPIQKSGKF